MRLKMFQIDAFTSEVFKGNPAAVVFMENWLEDKLLQSIAQENNLSETAFLIPKGLGYEIRWFTPCVEVELCGHATLASSHVIFSELGFSGSEIHFMSKSGELVVWRENKNYFMDFPAEEPFKCEAPEKMLLGLGVNPKETLKSTDYIAVLNNEQEVEQLSLDFTKLVQLDSRGVIVTSKSNSCDFVSRCFYPKTGIDEDPVTGSAHCQLMPYWANQYKKTVLTGRQLSPRGGQIRCELKENRVVLEGKATTFFKGDIYIPG
ncbi:MAG: isomerase [Candidatus Marinimicrobia bacterium]|nr:isomerase [Candidatus Neomarinimicrobiota bacterium]|tara:strand:+ start:4312 stop:5097 length:786 start_codon:yes stop_codon:yes gene_type:complete